MSRLKYAVALVFTLVAALFLYIAAEKYAMREPSDNNYLWPERSKQATIIFGGDIMFDRSVRKAVDVKGGNFIFSCIDETLKSSDLIVANLEGPITNHASVSATSTPGGEFNYTFTFPPATAGLLYKHKVRIVNLRNNHILNFGTAGVRSTISELENAGVWYFGDPIHHSVYLEHAFSPIIFAFINYNEFAPTEHTNILEYVGMSSTTVESIQKTRARGYIPIVYTHWGEEYATTSSAYSRELAHSFIDAGAEIVIGSHPHVVQEHEIYNGKHIYYSLGNFIFDQYFSDDVRRGLLLRVVFGTEGVKSIKEIPVYLETDRRTCPVE